MAHESRTRVGQWSAVTVACCCIVGACNGNDGNASDADAYADADADAHVDADANGGIGGTWVMLDPGAFQMGSPTSEPGRNSDETQHSVTLTHRFEMLATEVTQAQFGERMGYMPAAFTACGGDCPVERVNWYEAAAYCNALSSAAGLANCYTCSGSGASVTCDLSGDYATPYDCPGYRLPTEAEWEYAARAGTTGGTYNGTSDGGHLGCEQPNVVLDSIAWFCGNSGGRTQPVGSLGANPWGLYDMLGNVWEWCGDRWDGADYGAGAVTDPWGLASGSSRVLRGGSWVDDAGYARAASRFRAGPGDRGDGGGFRVSRSLPP